LNTTKKNLIFIDHLAIAQSPSIIAYNADLAELVKSVNPNGTTTVGINLYNASVDDMKELELGIP
jgi:hypothetical protein